MNFCPKCGSKIKENQTFCINCGNKLIMQQAGKETNQQLGVQDSFQTNNNFQSANFKEQLPVQYDSAVSYNQNNQYGEQVFAVKKKSSKKFIVLGAVAGVLAVIGVTAFIFKDNIASTYYVTKGNMAKTDIEKVKFYKDALSKKVTDTAVNKFTDSYKTAVESDADECLSILESAEDMLPEENYKILMIATDKAQVSKYVKANEFDKAYSKLVDAKQYGYGIKTDSNYEKLILKLACSIGKIDGDVNDKDSLEKKGMVTYGDLDNDGIDEIVTAENKADGYYSNGINLQLYKYNKNQYKAVGTLTPDEGDAAIKMTIAAYAKGKNALFIEFIAGAHTGMTNVYTVKGNELDPMLSGALSSIYPVEFSDIDKDNIVEVASMDVDPSSIDQSYGGSDKITTWYKVQSSGKLEEVKKDYTKNNSSSNSSSSENNTTINTGDYMFPNSDRQYLTDADVMNLTKEQLGLARNEIFARHGYIFQKEPYKSYFSAKSWYTPNTEFKGGDDQLNDFEIKNYQLIKKYEDSKQ